MNTRNQETRIRLAGRELTFWPFLGSAVLAYLAAVVLAVLLGPLGALAGALIGTATTALLVAGLLLFFLQRPAIGMTVLLGLGVIHFALLRAGVPAGLFWLVWSKAGLHWIESLGF